MKIQQSSGGSGLISGVTDHDEDALKERRKVEANRGREREEKDAERSCTGESWRMWWRRSKSILDLQSLTWLFSWSSLTRLASLEMLSKQQINGVGFRYLKRVTSWHAGSKKKQKGGSYREVDRVTMSNDRWISLDSILDDSQSRFELQSAVGLSLPVPGTGRDGVIKQF